MHRFSVVLVLVIVLGTASVSSGQDTYCTLSQNLYGNENGEFNGMSVPFLIDILVSGGSPLMVGAPGRSVTFLDGSESAIIQGLSSSHRPAALPEGLGDVVVDSSGNLPDAFPANKRGKFENMLLGETIALSLNTRLDPWLYFLEVQPVMHTVAVLPGDDGLVGTPDDSVCATCDTMTIRIPDEVLAALGDSTGAGATVGDILGLANLTLAGQDTLFEVTPAGVNEAVKVLNRGFKRCRFLVGASVDSIVIIDIKAGSPSGGDGDAPSEADRDVFSRGISLHAVSPVSDQTTVSFNVPESSSVRVSVYDVAGREVGIVFLGDVARGDGSIQLPLNATGRLSTGVYFLRVNATGLVTGRTYSETAKVVVIR